MVRNYNPILEVGQNTQATHSFTLIGLNERPYKAIDLTNAETVRLTMEHRDWGETVVSGGICEVPEDTAEEGYVEYMFSAEETRYYGTHYIQFEITWANGDTERVPPEGIDWTLYIGRRLPSEGPLRADIAYIGELGGPLDAAGFPIQNVGDATGRRDAVPKEYVDDIVGENLTGASNPATADYDFNSYKGINLGAPENLGDAARLDETQANAEDIATLDAAKAPLDGGGTATLANYDAAQIASQLDIPVYADDANAPNSTHYFNSADGLLKYKDASGVVHGPPEPSGGDVSNPMDADLDAGGHAVTNAGAVDTDALDVSGWNWVDVSNHVPTHDIDTATLQGVTDRTDYPDYASCVGPINDLFAQFGEKTVYIFPAGDYWVPWDEIIRPSGISRDLAIVCRPGSRFVHEPFTEDTTLADGSSAEKWMQLFDGSLSGPIENLHLSGMTVNFEADECGRGIQTTTSGSSTIEDLTIVGQVDSLDSGDRPLTPRVPDDQGVLYIDRYEATDGALWDTSLDMSNPDDSSLRHQGIFVGGGADNAGTVVIRDCALAGWTSHAIYASKTEGPVRVIRPRLRNNRGVGVRVGATGSTVEDPRVIIDNTSGQISDYDSIRPIRVEGTGQTGGGENITVRNPEIILRSVPQSITRYALEIDPTIRSAKVEGGYVHTDEPQQLTRLDAATVPNDGIVIEDLTFKRDAPPASDSLASIAAINLYRNRVELRDVNVRCQMNDGTKSRGVLLRSDHCVIDGGTFFADQGGLFLAGSENLIKGSVHINSNGDGIEYSSGSDNRLVELSKTLIEEAGTSVQAGGRTRWNGIIGAGPLGGVDLSTTHGKEIGDFAISDGSAGDVGFPDGSMARWRGSSWVRVDGQETITPA